MFVREDYDDYHYAVSVSDNYVILAKTRSVNGTWENPQTIPVIYQYFNPSQLVIEGTRSFNNYQTFTNVDVDSDFFNRPDCSNILTCVFFIIFLTVFVINQCTAFVHRGGIFGK